MKSFTSITAMALLAIPTAFTAVIGTPVDVGAPDPVKRAAECTATVKGYNSEGGGGPGQTPIDNNSYGVTVVGPGGTANGKCSETGSDSVPCDTIPASSYGGTYDTTCSGDWDGGSNSWYSCTCNQVGGAVQPDSISSGTVSVTTDYCIVVYDC